MKKRNISIVISLLVFVLAIAVSFALVNKKPVASKHSEKQNIIAVKTHQVAEEQKNTSVYYPGRVSSYNRVSLSAEVSGRIMQGDIPLKEGESFVRGQLLLELYGEDTEASVKASKSSFLKNLSEVLPDLSVDYPESYEKWRHFFEEIRFDSSLPPLPEIENETERVFLASNDILSSYYSIQQQEITLSKYKIKAPFNGYYKTVNKEVGSFSGTGTEIATIIRSDKYEVTVPVPVNNAKKIIIGSKVTVISGEEEFKGHISRKAGFIDESTQSVNIYVTCYPQENQKLLDGEYVSVRFKTINSSKGILLPREAVMSDSSVYLVEQGRLRKVSVNVIQQLNDSTLISGPETGDLLVMESLVNVEEGQEVELLTD